MHIGYSGEEADTVVSCLSLDCVGISKREARNSQPADLSGFFFYYFGWFERDSGNLNDAKMLCSTRAHNKL